MTLVRNVVLVLLFFAGLNGAARALTFQNLAGKWCGITTNYQFSSDTLAVMFHDGAPTLNFKVTGYDYNDDVITMRWVSEGQDRVTEFSEFNADDTEMAQVQTKTAPRRPFHRC
jgi:hypothetical protein